MRQMLVIDDERVITLAIKNYFTRLGNAVDTAAEREEAEALLATRRYDVVIADVRLEGMDGREGLDILRFVRERCLDARVVLMTAYRAAPRRRCVPQEAGAAPADGERRERAPGGRALMEFSLIDTIVAPGSLSFLFQPIVRTEGSSYELYAYEALTRGPAGTNVHAADVLFEYVRRKQEEVRAHAASAGISTERLVIEIVEYAPGSTGPAFAAALEKLRRRGCAIALDDVGLGNSNYRMILDSRPDYYKVDRFLVDGVAADPYRLAIIRSLGSLGGAVGAIVVAEGVESEQDVAALRSAGISLFQGFFFGRPKPAAELAAGSWMFDQTGADARPEAPSEEA
jgi:EAL domain-containing protein (putative c-di-GMP-specific phosphodiesterase class I)